MQSDADMPVLLRTGRLVLRPWVMADASELARVADDPEIAAWMRDVFPNPYTLADARRWIAGQDERHPLAGLAITADGELAGAIGLHPLADVHRYSAEVGYWIAKDHWGRGYATEALSALCDHVFEHTEFERLFGCVFDGNEASGRVLEKCGFTLESIQRRAVFKHGRFCDMAVHVRLRE